MSYYFQVCSSESYQQKYLIFLLEHYNELNLPYSFPVSLSFLASPVLLTKEAFLCFNNEDEVVGAFSYICGTAENQYTDTHVVQIQIIFFVEKYRRSRLFLESLQFLVQYISQLPESIVELRFWVPVHLRLNRLLAKLAVRAATWETAQGVIDEYHAEFKEWQDYIMKFGNK
ncbi:hypothetical protein [Cohnella herbarum]|uniref:GNAT family N-acetyltransferase n=1 Tax=Cohnella herbarum TaxID=2728023 RepID=A0A7Z2VLQ3_9BACL|nr:hypothetical protein [Cohnella herbarum]QJD85616.1 hypothetical protein HH215_22145 [Cohnella herbarum]